MKSTLEELTDIVQHALTNLSEKFPDTVSKIVHDNNFVTIVDPLMDKKYQVMVDFTKQMVYNYEIYMLKSERLYEKFLYIDKWYRC